MKKNMEVELNTKLRSSSVEDFYKIVHTGNKNRVKFDCLIL